MNFDRFSLLVAKNAPEVQERLRTSEKLLAASVEGVLTRINLERDMDKMGQWWQEAIKDVRAAGVKLSVNKKTIKVVSVDVSVGGEDGLVYIHRVEPRDLYRLMGKELVAGLKAE